MSKFTIFILGMTFLSLINEQIAAAAGGCCGCAEMPGLRGDGGTSPWVVSRKFSPAT